MSCESLYHGEIVLALALLFASGFAGWWLYRIEARLDALERRRQFGQPPQPDRPQDRI